MGRFIDSAKLQKRNKGVPKQTHKKWRDWKTEKKNFPTKNSSESDRFAAQFYQTLKKDLQPVFLNLNIYVHIYLNMHI